MPEGAGTVLDNSCLMFIPEYVVGQQARFDEKLPLVLAGELGGTLEGGRGLDYLDTGDDKRKLCSLYLSIMNRMGIEQKPGFW